MTPLDVLVVGGGQAGLAAGYFLRRGGLAFRILDGNARPGGSWPHYWDSLQLFSPAQWSSLPGWPMPVGAHLFPHRDDVVAYLAAYEARYALPVRRPVEVRSLARGDGMLVADTSDGQVSARAVLMCTGNFRSPHVPSVPGQDVFRGRQLHSNMGRDLARFAGKRVLVVGGGDDAFEHAQALSELAASVTLVHRSDRFTARPSLSQPVRGSGRVTVRPFTVVRALAGDARLEAAVLRGPDGDETVALDDVLVCIGPTPNSEGLGAATDRAGYLRVDRHFATSRPGLYAIGDVCCPEAPTVSTAFGHGAAVAKVLCARLGGTTTPDPDEGPVDTLRVEGLSLPARIGVYPRERMRRQALGFSLAFEVSARAAARSDHLRDTVDYAAALDTITAVLARQHFQLIETVAECVAEALLARFACRAVTVRVHKPGVPQRGATASVEAHRRRV